MKINKEGYIIIGITGLLCLGVWSLIYLLLDTPNAVLWFMAGFLLVFWFFVAAFFREPRRVQIHDESLVFSPCDGRVVVTEVVHEDEYLKQDMLQIIPFLNLLNVEKIDLQHFYLSLHHQLEKQFLLQELYKIYL